MKHIRNTFIAFFLLAGFQAGAFSKDYVPAFKTAKKVKTFKEVDQSIKRGLSSIKKALENDNKDIKKIKAAIDTEVVENLETQEKVSLL